MSICPLQPNNGFKLFYMGYDRQKRKKGKYRQKNFESYKMIERHKIQRKRKGKQSKLKEKQMDNDSYKLTEPIFIKIRITTSQSMKIYGKQKVRKENEKNHNG